MRKLESTFDEHGMMVTELFFDSNPYTNESNHVLTTKEYEFFGE